MAMRPFRRVKQQVHIAFKKLFDKPARNMEDAEYSFQFDHQTPVQAELFNRAAD